MKLLAHIITYFLPNADPILVACWLALGVLMTSVIWTKIRSQAMSISARFDRIRDHLEEPDNDRTSGQLEVCCQ